MFKMTAVAALNHVHVMVACT